MEKQLNNMCIDCRHLDKLCDGSHSDIYSGCIWKNADAETMKSFLQKEHFKYKFVAQPGDFHIADPAERKGANNDRK